jgi:hypothetical protein
MDESGLLMAPLVRRSWAPKGHPPVIRQKGGFREKVSVAGALWLPPSRDRLGLAYQTMVNGYFTNVEVAEFIGCAVEGLPGPVIAIWDGGSMHKGARSVNWWNSPGGGWTSSPCPRTPRS